MSLDRLLQLRVHDESTGFWLDLAPLGIEPARLDELQASFEPAFAAMAELEAGAIANPDEGRRVGHYWLRAPEMAPDRLGDEVRETNARIRDFAHRVLDAQIFPPRGGRYQTLCLIGIGGSALGPQLVIDALAEPGDGLAFCSLDNTDPDGIERVLARIDLSTTLFVVISKSGGTKETRNGMLEAAAACASAGVDFAKQAVAVTGAGSELDRRAQTEGWVERFPMWDWVGGRTSVTSAVGLLPAALCGIDTQELLAGAREMDVATRRPTLRSNLAAAMAAAWFTAGDGRGSKDMVVLPYRDRLLLLGRYLQQLIMESLGKARDLEGRRVEQGLTVYGNKGSTDQHAYVQQLRDGLSNFFVCFVRVLDDQTSSRIEVDAGTTSGDYLHGFWLGTQTALSDAGRANFTLTMPRVDAFALGALIALFERAVGLYASAVGINAYHQPGVEAGKKAAGAALALRDAILGALGDAPQSAEDLAQRLGADAVTVQYLLEHLNANRARTQVSGSLADGYRKTGA